jgi:hypothetical protein
MMCTRCGDEAEKLAPLNGTGTEACGDCRLDHAAEKARAALAAPGTLEAIKRAGSKVFSRPELRTT